MAFGRLAKDLNNAKVWKKSFNKSGRILENAGYATTALGTVSGQPEIVGAGSVMIGTGKLYQGVGQGIKYFS